MKKVIIMVIVMLIILLCAILAFNTKVEVEYVPEEEISNIDLRKTVVALYFKDTNNGNIQKESRLIDSKELLLDPYTVLINMLIAGPESDLLEKIIPEGTKINEVNLVGNCVNIDLSKEFLENTSMNEDNLNNAISSIKNTLTELNEVDSVKITVEGEEI